MVWIFSHISLLTSPRNQENYPQARRRDLLYDYISLISWPVKMKPKETENKRLDFQNMKN